MKLVFSKNEELEISVHSQSGSNKAEFSYIEMIKELIKEEKLDTPELVGEFTEAEKESVNSMIKHINDEVANFYSDEENPE